MTKKNEILTKEQEAQLIQFREEWRKHGLSCERIDKETTKRCISELYNLIGKKPPVFIFCPSLLSAQYQIAYCKNMFKLNKDIVEKNLGENLYDKQIYHLKMKLINNLSDNLIDNITDNLKYNLWYKLCDNLNNLINNLWHKINDNLTDRLNKKYECSSLLGSMDAHWIAFYEFPKKFLGIRYCKKYEEILDTYSTLAKSFSFVWCYENYCFVSDRPEKLLFNKQNRLHCEDGPAVKWIDGSEIYYYNGVEVPKEWILDRNSITRETIINEKNAEKRRCICEIIGTKQYATLINIEEIDKDHVNGQDVILYKTKEKDDIIKEHIYYVNVTCHSTQRKYFICIPKKAAKNAWSAVAWTFKMNEQEYKPIIET